METLGIAEREALAAEAAVLAARQRTERFSSPGKPRQRTVLSPSVVNIPPAAPRALRVSHPGLPSSAAPQSAQRVDWLGSSGSLDGWLDSGGSWRQHSLPPPLPRPQETSIQPTQDNFPAKSVAAPKLYAPRDKALLCVYATVAIDMLGSALTVQYIL